ncbi:MAG: (d)CMP kinase [Acidobacteriota bacterium]|nr:MAG: (d)CMP kinase [Acidobacteriota bacterium]
MNRKLIIAIDGPAGAGKSTVAKKVARQLDYLFINTGAMYRAVAWKALQIGIPLDDIENLGRLALESRIELTGPVDSTRVLIDGEDITEAIASPRVSQAASVVSSIPAVRRALVARQQEMGKTGGVVMEGRDIGTVVFPNADIKIYLDASSEARSRRRFDEDTARGVAVASIDQMRSEIEERDMRDKTREDSPLAQARDAIFIDSSSLSIEEVVTRIIEAVSAKLNG